MKNYLSYYKCASDHLLTFDLLNKKLPSVYECTSVKYYLLCRSLELGLKAYILLESAEPEISVSELKKEYHHDLRKLLDKAVSINDDKRAAHATLVNIAESDLNTVELISLCYLGKAFEYPVGVESDLPALFLLRDTVYSFLRSVADQLGLYGIRVHLKTI